MVKTIDFRKATKDFEKLLEDVKSGTNQYVVKDNGQELAVLLSFNDFNNFQRLAKNKTEAKERFFKIVDKIQKSNKDVPCEQIETDVAQAVGEVRKMKQKEKTN